MQIKESKETMLVILKRFPNAQETETLLQFCIDVGADRFTIIYSASAGASVRTIECRLRPFVLGMRKSEIPSIDGKREFRKVSCWLLNPSSLSVIQDIWPEGILESGQSFVFYRGAWPIFAALFPSRVAFLKVASNHWEELFRRGLEFRLVSERTGKVLKEDFNASDLPENSIRLPSDEPKSVAAILASPFYRRSLRPTHGGPPPDASLADNPHILEWWTPQHDELIRYQLSTNQGNWWPDVAALAGITPRHAFLKWQIEDPLCLLSTNWGTVLADFARARAETTGLSEAIIWSALAKKCALCGRMFEPQHMVATLMKNPVSLVRRIVLKKGSYDLAVCDWCLSHALYHHGHNTATREQAISYLCEVARLIGRVPNSNFPIGCEGSLIEMTVDQQQTFLALVNKKPSPARINELFGSYLSALIEAGILESGTRRTERGTQCLAKDGHACLSLAEKTIDDFLFEANISHEREVQYPEGKYRCDFMVRGVFVEYLGLSGSPTYDERTKAKIEICRRNGIGLLEIYPEDLAVGGRLEEKLGLFGKNG